MGLRRWGGVALGALIGLAAFGAGVQLYATWADRGDFPAPGRLIEVGDRRLHIDCRGDGDGPTIVLEASLGGFSAYWAWVVDTLRATRRVCAYDRSGLGWSEGGSGVRDTITAIRLLNRLLDQSGERAPYVLVGHGLGGAYVRTYAARFRSAVVGVVTIDSMHPDQFRRLPNRVRRQFSDLRVSYGLAEIVAHVGLMRVRSFAANMAGDLPPSARQVIRAFAALPDHLNAAGAEVAVLDDSLAQAGVVHTLSDLPLLVLNSERVADIESAEWDEMQADLARLSSRGRRAVIAGASGETGLTREGTARAVARPIETFVASIEAPPAVRPPAASGR